MALRVEQVGPVHRDRALHCMCDWNRDISVPVRRTAMFRQAASGMISFSRFSRSPGHLPFAPFGLPRGLPDWSSLNRISYRGIPAQPHFF